MRFYSGFLLLEDVFDNLPGTLSEIDSFADSVFNPTLLVASEDCQTQLGTIEKVQFSLEGKTELATGLVVTKDRIIDLLTASVYSLNTRDIHSCVEPTGICQACYVAGFPNNPVPDLNTRVRVESDYILSTDVFTGNDVSTQFTLSLTPLDYNDTLVYYDGILQTGYTINETILTLPFAPAIDNVLVVHFRLTSAKPFFGYLSNTYTGGLVGIKPLPTEPLIVRPSLIHSVISAGQLNRVQTLLMTFTTIESTYRDFIDAIPDNLEKALYMIMLYGIYGNVNI